MDVTDVVVLGNLLSEMSSHKSSTWDYVRELLGEKAAFLSSAINIDASVSTQWKEQQRYTMNSVQHINESRVSKYTTHTVKYSYVLLHET